MCIKQPSHKASPVLCFFYDSFGDLNCIRYIKTADDGTVTTRTYYTATNAQGDVVSIFHDSGKLLARYDYDAWGNVVAIRNADGGTLTPTKNPGHIAILNPIRYRGYYYDTDLGLYYLQSRYYDATIGRFINADSVISDVGGDVLRNNLFAYCGNNPVNMSDPTGHWSKNAERVGFIASCVLAVAAVVATIAAVAASAPIAVVGACVAAVSVTVSGIVDGIGNAANGDSYINGCVGGYVSGFCEEVGSITDKTETGMGNYIGGIVGCGLGTAV